MQSESNQETYDCNLSQAEKSTTAKTVSTTASLATPAQSLGAFLALIIEQGGSPNTRQLTAMYNLDERVLSNNKVSHNLIVGRLGEVVEEQAAISKKIPQLKGRVQQNCAAWFASESARKGQWAKG